MVDKVLKIAPNEFPIEKFLTYIPTCIVSGKSYQPAAFVENGENFGARRDFCVEHYSL